MTANIDGSIELVRSPYYKYRFRCLELDNNITQPVISIPLVSTGSSNTFLFRFSGQSETIRLKFEIFDDGVDTAGGTYTSTVTTIAEQIAYLKNEIYLNDYDIDWYFQQTSRYFPTAIQCVITDLTFNNPAGSASSISATMNLQVGNIGNI